MTDILAKSSTRARLQNAKAAAVKLHNDWREMRQKISGANCDLGRGYNTEHGRQIPVICCFSKSSIPAYSVEYADDAYKGIKHTGWFADDDMIQGTIRGIVCRIDGRKWLIGYYWSDNGEYVVRVDTVYSDIEAAAIAADRFAENYAEICRDDARKYNEAREIWDKADRDGIRLRECLILRHKKCMSYVRSEISELCKAIRQAREVLRTEYADGSF